MSGRQVNYIIYKSDITITIDVTSASASARSRARGCTEHGTLFSVYFGNGSNFRAQSQDDSHKHRCDRILNQNKQCCGLC